MPGIRGFRPPKKAKQVTGNKPKLSKLAELKKVNREINIQSKSNDKFFRKMDKLHDKSRKLREQLGIDR